MTLLGQRTIRQGGAESMSPKGNKSLSASALRDQGQGASALITIKWPLQNYLEMIPEQRLLAAKSMAILLGLRELYKPESLDKATNRHPECVLELPDPQPALGAELGRDHNASLTRGQLVTSSRRVRTWWEDRK